MTRVPEPVYEDPSASCPARLFFHPTRPLLVDASAKRVVYGSITVVVGITLATLLIIWLSGGLTPEGPVQMYPEDALDVSFDLSYGTDGNRTSELRFEADVQSMMEDTLRGYAFIYATNEQAEPPLRSISPPGVLSRTNPERRFHINTASEGHALTMPPGDVTSLSGRVLLPTTWHDGTPIEADRFTRLQFYVLDEQSRRLYRRTWQLTME